MAFIRHFVNQIGERVYDKMTSSKPGLNLFFCCKNCEKSFFISKGFVKNFRVEEELCEEIMCTACSKILSDDNLECFVFEKCVASYSGVRKSERTRSTTNFLVEESQRLYTRGWLNLSITCEMLSQGRRFAFLIGIDKYEDQNNLAKCIYDVNTIGSSLEKIGYEVTPMKDSRLSEVKSEFDKLMSEKVRDGDTLVFLFCGHGSETFGNLDIYLSDKREQLNFFIKKMNKKKKTTNILILDCCRVEMKYWDFKYQLPEYKRSNRFLMFYRTCPEKSGPDDGELSTKFKQIMSKSKGKDAEAIFSELRKSLKSENCFFNTNTKSTTFF